MIQAALRLGASVVDVSLLPGAPGHWVATVEGDELPMEVHPSGAGRRVRVAGTWVEVHMQEDGVLLVDGTRTPFEVLRLVRTPAGAAQAEDGLVQVRPPMTGRLDSVAVEPGQAVRQGDVLFVLEAMKMRNEVRAPVGGTVAGVHGRAGDTVGPARVLVELRRSGVAAGSAKPLNPAPA